MTLTVGTVFFNLDDISVLFKRLSFKTVSYVCIFMRNVYVKFPVYIHTAKNPARNQKWKEKSLIVVFAHIMLLVQFLKNNF